MVNCDNFWNGKLKRDMVSFLVNTLIYVDSISFKLDTFLRKTALPDVFESFFTSRMFTDFQKNQNHLATLMRAELFLFFKMHNPC